MVHSGLERQARQGESGCGQVWIGEERIGSEQKKIPVERYQHSTGAAETKTIKNGLLP